MQQKNIHTHKILILDFGSQYTQLIARRIREIGVYCEIYSCECSDEEVKNFAPNGIILSGGPETVTSQDTPRAPQSVFELGVPVLGICYGMQAMTEQLGGKVESSSHREFGYAQIRARGHSKLLSNIEDHVSDEGFGLLDVWMSHGDRVVELPEGFITIASSDGAPIAGIANEAKGFYALQFHPEVTHTKQGGRILSRFVLDLCGCDAFWTANNIIEDSIRTVREKVGTDHVILGLSGGVDSSVVAALLHKAIGTQLTCVFVDTGLLRLHEGDAVMAVFAEHLGVKVIRVNAEQRYLDALSGITDPEQKRKIIGNLFIEIFDDEAGKITDAKWLAQGTIYPDVIESADTNVDPKSGERVAVKIKSHHNVGGLPKDLRFKLVEPLRKLFKDEVRKVGRSIGLPEEIVRRHPFPGPGLAIRILGEVTAEKLNILRDADLIVREEINRQGVYHDYWQAFAVLLPVRSVGVMGDHRTYAYPIVLRFVSSEDGMTADWSRVPYDLLELISNRIVNEVRGVNRVVYDITSKPPGTIEWE
ncbi:MAG TPA: GMP synthase (glutamine-hydrolyzing) [Planktothrix sp. UBA8402]|nr:GMP synthase (glutamine-hydrolyzing) [Planktothrix sp. UBA8402]